MLLWIILIGGVGALLLGFLAMSGPSASKSLKRRIELVKERHGDIIAGNAQAQIRKLMAQRTSRIESYASTLIPKPALMRKRLEMTGKDISLGKYAMVCVGVAVLVAAAVMFRGAPILLSMLLGLFFGIGGPHFVIGKMIDRRVRKFTANFPDAIELMVRGLRSGLPISETIGIVADEIPNPVGIEFRTVADKMRIGRTMDAALQDASERLGTAEFQFYVISLAIQRETGGNLAETLSNLADVLRKRSAMKLKIRAMSSESKASAYIIGALPFIVFGLIWFINGSYMQNFFIDQRLMIAGGIGLVWMAIGAFIMAKMINFEI
jgi:tight adherence protein B